MQIRYAVWSFLTVDALVKISQLYQQEQPQELSAEKDLLQ